MERTRRTTRTPLKMADVRDAVPDCSRCISFHPVEPGSYAQSAKNGSEIDVCSMYAILAFGKIVTQLAIGSIRLRKYWQAHVGSSAIVKITSRNRCKMS